MDQYKEFQGKNLDDAIKSARVYFGVDRERLEIEILSDGKSGIFGLVGMKKATIRARRAGAAAGAVASLLGQAGFEPGHETEKTADRKGASGRDALPEDGAGKGSAGSEIQGKKKSAARKRKPGDQDTRSEASDVTAPAGGSVESRFPEHTPDTGVRGAEVSITAAAQICGAPQGAEPDRKRNFAEKAERPVPGDSPEKKAALPPADLTACEREELFNTVRTILLELIKPIVGEAHCEVTLSGKRLRATLDCGDVSGLLVGRDGQTLASLQYLATRILSRRMGGEVRLQVDVGKYRERQDDKLRELALSLAKRVKRLRRAQSTRPLTAYQRRIVHLVLEGDNAVETHSTGEGLQRRVVVQLRRGKAEAPLADEDYIHEPNSSAVAPPANIHDGGNL